MLIVVMCDLFHLCVCVCFHIFLMCVMELIRIKDAIKGRKKVLRLRVLGVIWATCSETLSFHRCPPRELAFWFCSSFSVPFLPTSVFSSFHFVSQHSLTLHPWDKTDVLPWGVVRTAADVCINSF